MSASQNSSDAETYLGLRNLMLHGSRAEFEIKGSFTKHQPWGVLMDIGYTESSVTLVALADGSASIYLSSGGGMIGGVGHQTIRKATQQMVQIASEFPPQMKQASSFPLPQTGETAFYVLTDGGVFTANAPEKELGYNRHLLSRLFHAGHAVINEFRLLHEGRETKS